MIKKINVAQLKPGMFVHDFACEWLENPFFKNSLLIKDEATIVKIVVHGIKELFIDTEKGVDSRPAVLPIEAVAEELPDEIETAGSTFVTMAAFEKKLIGIVPRDLRDELPEAMKLRREMETAMEDVFQDISSGKSMDISATREVSGKIVESVFRNNDALPCVAKAQNTGKYFVSRALNVSSLMTAFAKYLGIPPVEIIDIATGALLYDVGMLKIDTNILKKTEKLTPVEYDEIRMHILYSYEIISGAAGDIQPALQMAMLHHERHDGSGYSQGVKGEQIPEKVRMLSIADSFDAMTTKRAYSGAINLSAANRKLLEMTTPGQLDETLVKLFIRCIGIYPVGTIVRLSSGKVGIVIRQNPDSLLKPLVKIIYDSNENRFVHPRDLDLSNLPDNRLDEKITRVDQENNLNISLIDLLLA